MDAVQAAISQNQVSTIQKARKRAEEAGKRAAEREKLELLHKEMALSWVLESSYNMAAIVAASRHTAPWSY